MTHHINSLSFNNENFEDNLSKKPLALLKKEGVKSREKYLQKTWNDCLLCHPNPQITDPAILAKRQLAIDEITLIKNAVTYDEVSNLSINFQ